MIDWVVAAVAATAALGLWWSEEWVEVGNKGKIKKETGVLQKLTMMDDTWSVDLVWVRKTVGGRLVGSMRSRGNQKVTLHSCLSRLGGCYFACAWARWLSR